jgi:hypothetical protein
MGLGRDESLARLEPRDDLPYLRRAPQFSARYRATAAAVSVASYRGARMQTSRSSSVVMTAGMAFGRSDSTIACAAVVREP